MVRRDSFSGWLATANLTWRKDSRSGVVIGSTGDLIDGCFLANRLFGLVICYCG